MAYKNILNELIYEELSISGDVQKEMVRLWGEILEKTPLINTVPKDGCPGVRSGNGDFITSLFGEKIHIYINLYKFKDKENFEDYKEYVEYLGASSLYAPPLRWITLNIPMISGTISCIDYVKDELQHEVEHIFQGKNGANGILDTDDKYVKLKDLAWHENEYVSNMARLLYLSRDYEQDAYVNGIYAFLMAQEEPKAKIQWDLVKETDGYRLLMEMRQVLEKLKEPSDEITQICQQFFNMSPHKMYKIGKATEFRFVRKMGKALAKYYKDIREKYNIQEHSFTKIKPFYFC